MPFRIRRIKKPAWIGFVEGVGTVVDMGGVMPVDYSREPIKPQSFAEIRDDVGQFFTEATNTIDKPKVK